MLRDHDGVFEKYPKTEVILMEAKDEFQTL